MDIKSKVKHVHIEIVRGDTEKIKICRSKAKEEKEIIKEKVDNLFFSVKENDVTREVLFQKKLSDNTITYTEDGYYHVVINPEDTDNLAYGTYFFDIERIIGNDVKTPVVGELEITSEITHHENEV